MKISLTLLLSILAVLTISCKTNKVTEVEPPNPVITFENSGLQGKWTLDYIMPVNGKSAKDLFKIQMPYLNFVDGTKVAGNNGCNNVSGGYSMKTDDNFIQFDTEKFASTRMFCENFDEKAFLNELGKVNRFDIIDDGNKLVMMTGDIVTMSFVKADK